MSFWTALLLIATATKAGGIQVESQVDCPDSGSIAARLATMLATNAFPGYRLRISARAAAPNLPAVVVLRLTDAQGTVIGARDWPRSLDCRAAADEVAVVAATWLTALPPPALSALPSVQVDRAAATTAAMQPFVTVAPAPTGPPSGAALGVGAGWVFTPDGQGVPAVTVRIEDRPARRPPLLWSIGFTAAGSWQQPLDQGRVSWRRWMGVMEVGIWFGWRRLFLGASGGVEAGALSFRGSLFSQPRSQIEPEIAACSTVRATLALGRGRHALRVWVAGRLTASMIHYHARIRDSDASLAISSFQAAPMLGVDFPLPF